MSTVPFHGKLSAAELIAALHSDPHAPMSAMLEVADRCNETCLHCYQIQGQKGEMSTESWLSIIDELAELGVIFLTLSGGEATLRHDFLELVAHARARKFAVKIYTNGLNMSEAMATSLSDLAVQEVQISLYSHRAEAHDKITCVPGSWEKTVQGVRYLRDAGVPVVLKAPLMVETAAEYPEYVSFVQELGADYGLSPHLDPREDGDRSVEVLRIDRDTHLKVLADPSLSAVPTLHTSPRNLDRSLCGACSGHVHIEANGEMRPCTQMTLKVGDASEGVGQAWRNDVEAKALRGLTWRDVHGCRDCGLQSYCSRCFANAQVEGQDALGPYLTACHSALLRYEVALGEEPSFVGVTALDRDPKLGPFEVDGRQIRPIEDVIGEKDKLFEKEHAWVRPSQKLVQLGKKEQKKQNHEPL